jgi:cytochrome c-type biogenesis protein CcmH/NrfF
MNILSLVVLTILLSAVPARAEVTTLRPLEEQLQRQLLAPCCYRETLYHHMSDAAVAMKAEIREMVASGKTDREILELYKLRYGRRILAEPEGATWWIEMLTPIGALAIGAILVIRIIGKSALTP